MSPHAPPIVSPPDSIEYLLKNITKPLVKASRNTLRWGPTQLRALKVVDISDLEIEDIVPTEKPTNDGEDKPYIYYLASSGEIDTTGALKPLFFSHLGSPFAGFYRRLMALLILREVQQSLNPQNMLMGFVKGIWEALWGSVPEVGSANFYPGYLSFKIQGHWKVKAHANRFIYEPPPEKLNLFRALNRGHTNLALLSFGETKPGEDPLAATAGELFSILVNRFDHLSPDRIVNYDKAYMLRFGVDETEVSLESTTLSDSYMLAILGGTTPEGEMIIKRSRGYNLLRGDDRVSLARAIQTIIEMYV